MKTILDEIQSGERFEFGSNWKAFLSHINEDRIRAAEQSIAELLGVGALTHAHAVDIGSGSGLSSLAFRRMGAKVLSFDYDPKSVACTRELKARYFPNDPNWQVTEGSILDRDFVEILGTFDLVYSWGVLHHTGSMWLAIERATQLVKPNGKLFIALYNDQGAKSRFWRHVKRAYCSGVVGKAIVTACFFPYFFTVTLLASLRRRENLFATYKSKRGMSIVHDWHDWLGGYPFEVAKVEDVFKFLTNKGFSLSNISTNSGFGCNQFVFSKT